MELAKLFSGPLFFEKNRVFRVYTGGALFADFFGDGSTDGDTPEEWVASAVHANNAVSRGEKEGVSRIEGTDLWFDDLLERYPKELLGDRKQFGVLTKLLDSAVRLPVQAHPDKPFSRKYFNSEYGKTESWIVLATRPGAKLYFGFNQPMTKEKLSDAVERSETDRGAMEALLNGIDVVPGDVFIVPARMVHAIGAGCLVLEVQEPTDFTIQPEHWCADYHLNDHEMYLDLPVDIAMDVFDYDVYGEEAIARGRRTPKPIETAEKFCRELLISYDDTPCFSVERCTLKNGSLTLTQAPAVCVVTEGEGEISWQNGKRPVKKGDYFFLPTCAKAKVTLSAEGKLQWVTCLPPKK
ncbi:MAG: class I mannose-6-phosphate isomerase [Saccharofermentans sp.]|nr:class I mannose-6-phosphate isomerase [Saccharofermentans sp.]